MTDQPFDPEQDADESLQEEVQDYLDLLLSQATEKPEAQINEAPPSTVHQLREQRRYGGVESQRERRLGQPLSMVAGTAVSRRRRPDDGEENEPPRDQAAPAADATPSRRRSDTVPEPHSGRPYAEPRRPLSLRMAPPGHAPATPEKKPEPPVTPAPVETPAPPVTEVRHTDTEPPPPLVAPAPVEPDVPAAEERQPALQATAWLDNGRPHWAQGRFECLLFKVGGLSLAVPLVELGTIYPMSEELTPLFGQIDWFMGLMPVKDGNIKTIDTARVVMPERYQDSIREHYRYVISINGVNWGLAVDSVATAISLDPDEVKWRGERSQRPWLAGTVVEHMCALLDVSQLALMFQREDHSRG